MVASVEVVVVPAEGDGEDGQRDADEATAGEGGGGSRPGQSDLVLRLLNTMTSLSISCWESSLLASIVFLVQIKLFIWRLPISDFLQFFSFPKTMSLPVLALYPPPMYAKFYFLYTSSLLFLPFYIFDPLNLNFLLDRFSSVLFHFFFSVHGPLFIFFPEWYWLSPPPPWEAGRGQFPISTFLQLSGFLNTATTWFLLVFGVNGPKKYVHTCTIIFLPASVEEEDKHMLLTKTPSYPTLPQFHLFRLFRSMFSLNCLIRLRFLLIRSHSFLF